MSKREEILEAALTEFSQKSYENTSVNTIIKSANASKGSFYHYFQNKEDLYIILLREALMKKSESMAFDGNRDVFSTLEDRIISGIKFSKENPKYYQLSRRFAGEKANDIYDTALSALSDSSEKAGKGTFSEEQYENANISSEYSREFAEKYIAMILEHVNELFDDEDDLPVIEEKLNMLIKTLRRGFAPFD